MRSEKEMYDLILNEARNNPHIKAVMMNGSRANPNIKKDDLQDYDIVYVVDDICHFLGNNWIDRFGKIAVMQTPDNMELFPCENEGTFAYLMQFVDGNRIDLTLMPVCLVNQYCYKDELAVILLDKENIFHEIPQSNDHQYYVKKPTQQEFYDCANEFYWVSTYVAKGLVRHELNYAMKHLNENVREMLLLMLSWKVGCENDFQVSVGKNYKYLQQYLNKELWQRLCLTYPNAIEQNIWKALFECTKLMEETIKEIASKLNYDYHEQELINTVIYLNQLYKKEN